MNVNEFRNEYLKVVDLLGQQHMAVISAVERRSDPENRPFAAVLFNLWSKWLGLNVTNLKTLTDTYGDETDLWIGQAILIYPTTTPFGKEIVDCIRLAAPGSQPPIQPIQPTTPQSMQAQHPWPPVIHQSPYHPPQPSPTQQGYPPAQQHWQQQPQLAGPMFQVPIEQQQGLPPQTVPGQPNQGPHQQ